MLEREFLKSIHKIPHQAKNDNFCKYLYYLYIDSGILIG